MKFSSTVFLASIFASAVALPVQVREPQAESDCGEQQVVTVTVTSFPSLPSGNNLAVGDLSLQEIDALTPEFGHDSNVNPTGSGDCDGAVNGSDGRPIKVPCACPPPRDQFIQVSIFFLA